MDLSLKDKHILILGSSSGIGYAIARGFANEGATVYLNGCTKDETENAVARIRKLLPDARVHGIVADLSTTEGYNTVTRDLLQVDILVNNLCTFEPLSFFDSKDEDWFKIFNVNVMTGIRLTRFYMPKMMARNWGRVIFISTESGLQIPTKMVHYGMSKTAQLSIANSLAQLTQGTGVTVNAILPGPTYADGVETTPLNLLQRLITPEEIAATVMLVSSDLGATTNGSAVRVDGGTLKGLA